MLPKAREGVNAVVYFHGSAPFGCGQNFVGNFVEIGLIRLSSRQSFEQDP
jgi:hypothetical protein